MQYFMTCDNVHHQHSHAACTHARNSLRVLSQHICSHNAATVQGYSNQLCGESALQAVQCVRHEDTGVQRSKF